MKYNFNQGHVYEGEDNINQPMFEVSDWTHNEYRGIKCRPVYKDSITGSTRYYHNGAYNQECALDGLWISCQWNSRAYMGDESYKRPYAFNFGYEGINFSIKEIEQATVRAKFLTKVEKAYTKYCTEFGFPETFEDYVVTIAMIIGIKQFIFVGSDTVYNYAESKAKIRKWYEIK